MSVILDPWSWVARGECRVYDQQVCGSAIGRWYLLPSAEPRWRYSLDIDDRACWVADYQPGQRHVTIFDHRSERGQRLISPLDQAGFRQWVIDHQPNEPG
jgi:hypothetical protein